MSSTNCTECGVASRLDASFCWSCGSPLAGVQPSWGLRHRVLVTAIVLVCAACGLLLSVGLIDSINTKDANERNADVTAAGPSPGAEASPTTVAPTTTTTTVDFIFTIGQPIAWPNGLIVTVEAPQRYAPKQSEYDPPDWVVAVTIENRGTLPYRYTPAWFKTEGSDSREYESAPMSGVDGALRAGDLPPTLRVKGLVGFVMGDASPWSVTMNDHTNTATWLCQGVRATE